MSEYARREFLRSRIERALREAYPNDAEKMIREMEVLGSWRDSEHHEKYLMRLADIMGVSFTAHGSQLRALSSTVWSQPHGSGTLQRGHECSVGRDLIDLPPSVMRTSRRIWAGSRLLIRSMILTTRGGLPLDGWWIELGLNRIRYLEGVDAVSASKGIALELPILVTDDDDFSMRVVYGGDLTSADRPYQFGFHLGGVIHVPLGA